VIPRWARRLAMPNLPLESCSFQAAMSTTTRFPGDSGPTRVTTARRDEAGSVAAAGLSKTPTAVVNPLSDR
jgi:hypothetical protein